MRESQRMAAVQSPVIPVVGRLVRAHPGTISLGQGVVHWGPPEEALARAAAFGADPDDHRYRPVEGIAELVAALGAKLETENGVDLAGRRVVVTAGANMGFANALLAVADQGDEVVLLAPYYFNHEMAVTMAGCRPVVVPTGPDHLPDLDAIAAAITPRSRAVVTISPNNPTGAVYPARTLAAVNALCRERGVWHVHDETYEYFTFGATPHASPAALPGSGAHTISLFSLSKAYGFASWRIGYMVIPVALAEAVAKIQDTVLICPPVISQHAALGALAAGRGWCAPRLVALAEVRELVLGALRGVRGASVPPAEGAFYVLVRLDSELDPMAVVERLIREHGVAVLPGTTFGVAGCTLRVAYGALERATVAEGTRRLVAGLADLGYSTARTASTK